MHIFYDRSKDYRGGGGGGASEKILGLAVCSSFVKNNNKKIIIINHSLLPNVIQVHTRILFCRGLTPPQRGQICVGDSWPGSLDQESGILPGPLRLSLTRLPSKEDLRWQ